MERKFHVWKAKVRWNESSRYPRTVTRLHKVKQEVVHAASVCM